MQLALTLPEDTVRETSIGEANQVERFVMPAWWDDDLHGPAAAALSNDWVTLGDIKPKLGEFSDRAFEILRDLVELGIAETDVRHSYRENGSITGGKAYYRKA